MSVVVAEQVQVGSSSMTDRDQQGLDEFLAWPGRTRPTNCAARSERNEGLRRGGPKSAEEPPFGGSSAVAVGDGHPGI